jgi:bacterioferritin (cytochrome b1)
MSTKSEPADAEGASSSIKDEIIRGLNEDLAREYKAIIQYVVFSNTLSRIWRYSRAAKKTCFTGVSTRNGGS